MILPFDSAETTSTIEVLQKVEAAINSIPGTAAKLPELNRFLKGLGKTLGRIITLSRVDEEIEWEEDLAEHASNITTGVSRFRKAVEKYDPLFGGESARSNANGISKEVRLALECHVKILQETVSRSQLVIEVFINLQDLSNLLQQSRTTTFTLTKLKDETQNVCQILPMIASTIDDLNTEQPIQSRGLKDVQQYAECLVRGDLDDSTTSLLELQETQIPVSEEGRALWQENLGLAVEELCTCCRNRADGLLKGQTDKAAVDMQKSAWQRAINTLVQIVDEELAAGLCIAFALEAPKAMPEESGKAIPKLTRVETSILEAKRDSWDTMDDDDDQAAMPGFRKAVHQKPLEPISNKNLQPFAQVGKYPSDDSSDKENGRGQASLGREKTSTWSGNPFAKSTWGSKSYNRSPMLARPISRISTRPTQRHNKSALSQEIIFEDVRDGGRTSMLASDEYSFALERWVNESDHLEILLNTGEQEGKQEGRVCNGSPEEYAVAVGRFPQILLKSMADWDDVCENQSPVLMSSLGKAQMAA